MTFQNTRLSASYPDGSKPTSRRRAGGKNKKSHDNPPKFEQLRSRSRRSDIDDDFGDFDDEDFEEDDDLDDFDDDDDLGGFDDDDEDFDPDFEN